MICEYTLPTISCHRQQHKSRAQEYQKCTSRRKTQLSSQWQLLQLFQTLVQTGILGGRGQVRQSGRKRIDQTIRVACSRHTNLHSWHELQTSISSKVENGIGLENLHKVGVVSCETMVGTGRLGKQQTHRISLILEGCCTPMNTFPNCFP